MADEFVCAIHPSETMEERRMPHGSRGMWCAACAVRETETTLKGASIGAIIDEAERRGYQIHVTFSTPTKETTDG